MSLDVAPGMDTSSYMCLERIELHAQHLITSSISSMLHITGESYMTTY